MRVGIVGAGVAGLVAARSLHDAGLEVVVLDKGRGVGGRLATRRKEQGAFDHGAQRFSARSDALRAQVARWEREGLVARTESPSDEPWWIPVPAANQLAKSLGAGLSVRCSARVTSMRREHRRWRLSIEGAPDEGPFDAVLLTAPAPQSAQLLAPHGLFEELARIRYEPTWALLLACDAAEVSWPEAIFSEGEGAISLLVREGLKPGRLRDDALVRLVVHASTAFSDEHLEDTEEGVSAKLIASLRERPGLARLRPRFAQAHRWRYARVAAPLGAPALFDRERAIGVAGDGMLGPRIEAAYESGLAVASALLAR